jgi:hypothetical protein
VPASLAYYHDGVCVKGVYMELTRSGLRSGFGVALRIESVDLVPFDKSRC